MIKFVLSNTIFFCNSVSHVYIITHMYTAYIHVFAAHSLSIPSYHSGLFIDVFAFRKSHVLVGHSLRHL